MLHAIVLLISILILNACSISPTQTDQPFSSTHLPLNNWQIIGKLAYRSPDENANARLAWQQNVEQFNIVLSGPLGQTAMKITGTTTNALIEAAGKESYKTSTPELALTQQTGLNIPLNALSYWIQGLPYPDQKSTYKLNKSGHKASIQQAGWRLEYSKYKLINNIWLPTKIHFYKNNTTLLLIIKQWSIP